MASIPGVIDKPTVDDTTLTCLPERTAVEGKSGGPRLAWPIIPVKRFVSVRSSPCPRVCSHTACLSKGTLSGGGRLVVAADREVEVSGVRRETSAAFPNP